MVETGAPLGRYHLSQSRAATAVSETHQLEVLNPSKMATHLKTTSFSWLSCMRELMFDVDDAPVSLPFAVVLFVSFVAVNIERTSLIPELVLDGLGGRLYCDFTI
jgi:hypothetical protein